MAIKNFGELLTDSFQGYKEHFKLFLRLGFFVYFLPLFIIELVYYFLDVSALIFIPTVSLANLVVPITAGIVKGIIIGIFTVFFTIGIIKALTIQRARGTFTFEEVLRESSHYLGKAIVLSIIMAFAILALLLFFIIPGVILAIFWSFAIYALVVDDVGISQSLHHSVKVVKGRWWTVFGYVLLMGLIVGVIIFAVVFATVFTLAVLLGIIGAIAGISSLMGAVLGVVSIFIATIVNMFLLPFTFTFMERFYVNLRDETPQLYDVKKI